MNVFKFLLMTSICSSVLVATAPAVPRDSVSRGDFPVNSQIVCVDKGGNDTLGNGTSIYPYLTITQAMASITDSAPTKRYVIKVGPGDYTDSFSLKANVAIV